MTMVRGRASGAIGRQRRRALRGRIIVGLSLSTAIAFLAPPIAFAGPYAQLAAQVQANGGSLTMTVTDDFSAQTPAALTSIGLSACHTIGTEGVVVTALQIVTVDGQLLLTLGATDLAGC